MEAIPFTAKVRPAGSSDVLTFDHRAKKACGAQPGDYVVVQVIQVIKAPDAKVLKSSDASVPQKLLWATSDRLVILDGAQTRLNALPAEQFSQVEQAQDSLAKLSCDRPAWVESPGLLLAEALA